MQEKRRRVGGGTKVVRNINTRKYGVNHTADLWSNSALCGRNDDESQAVKRAHLIGHEGEVSLDLLIRR